MPQTAKTKKALAKSAAAYTAAHTPTKKKTTTKTVGTKTTVTSPTGKTYEFDSKTYKGTDLAGAIKAAEAGTYGGVNNTYFDAPNIPTETVPTGEFVGRTPGETAMVNAYLDLLEAQFSNDPNAIFNTDAFKNVKKTVDATWGRLFQKEFDLVKSEYERSKTDIEAQASYRKETLGQERQRTLQDTGIKTQRIARNLDEAKQESAMAMANRGLTFGGARRKEETKLTTQAGEDVSDLEKESKRTLEDILGKKKYYGIEGEGVQLGQGEYGRSLQEKDIARQAEERRLENERTLQYESELESLRKRGSELLSSKYNY